MGEILAGEATPAQIAGFAVALRAKGETIEEVTGLLEAMYAVATPLVVAGRSLDVVGTGGAPLRPTGHTRPNSELQIDDTFGILRLTLHQASYDWQFIDVAGSVRDEGSGACHAR